VAVPVLKPREVVVILNALGFVEVRQRGSHKQFRHVDGRGTLFRFTRGETSRLHYYERSPGILE
jgi:predicted RNA binding protein YcfA (HicA-like mRNA interferase family)